jgi:hypothetical protein
MDSLSTLVVLAQTAGGEAFSGRIQGGWNFVWVSYGIAWGAIALYSLSLWLRRPKAPSGPRSEP